MRYPVSIFVNAITCRVFGFEAGLSLDLITTFFCILSDTFDNIVDVLGTVDLSEETELGSLSLVGELFK